VVIDNLTTGFPEALIHGEELVVGDLEDKALLQKLFAKHQFDAVLHFAASIQVGESVANPLKYYRNNFVNAINLMDVCVEYHVKKFIFSSTAAVYGNVQTGFVTEETDTHPLNAYGASKLMFERVVKDVAHAHGLQYAILRYFNVAGADQSGKLGQRTPNATHLIKLCCQAALGLRDSITIFGTDYNTIDGTGVRDYIHIQDLALAHVDALGVLDSHPEKSILLNVGYGVGSSVRQVIAATERVSGKTLKVIETGRREGDPAEVVAKNELLRRTLDWKPKFNDLTTIIADAYRWEKSLFER
jgi:UDP-glucose 4-epimerase